MNKETLKTMASNGVRIQFIDHLGCYCSTCGEWPDGGGLTVAQGGERLASICVECLRGFVDGTR